MKEKAIEEPSMDEILASIRQIISEPDKKEGSQSKAQPKDDDILDLTQLLSEETSSYAAYKKKAATPKSSPLPQKKSADRTPPSLKRIGEGFVDNNDLMNLLNENRGESLQSSTRERTQRILPNQTIEDLVREALNPLLKDWLHGHLPQIVREVVGEKVEKIIRQIGK
jgi:cell pole-organizing protein PopZ